MIGRRRLAVLSGAVFGLCAVGLLSTVVTLGRLHAAFVAEVQNTYVTTSVSDLNFGWVDSSRLVRQPLLAGWQASNSGVLGGLLDHAYVWVPDRQQWAAHSRGDGHAWAYFRRHSTLPFVATVDTGASIIFQTGRGGMFRHERTAYACAFGLSAPLGSWQVGALY